MPMPEPTQGEALKEFISRFMSSEITKREYPDHNQRVAVAYSAWRSSGRSAPTPQNTLSRYTNVTRRQGAYG